ncbi:hypothetical protein C4D60_Mb02t19870 [Musa balbisiana]|uniref:Uncharacterized protein n=1 Tax=Musa balbisiana TaxID=52838 RepID=A0A4S8IBZ0_MUSBA|nr:hypothetical protein C4D60_Mb02t19870 [Musa balbisiana]
MASLRGFLSRPHESNPASSSGRRAPRRRRPRSPNFGRNYLVTSSSPRRDLVPRFLCLKGIHEPRRKSII